MKKVKQMCVSRRNERKSERRMTLWQKQLKSLHRNRSKNNVWQKDMDQKFLKAN
jgi:hypothetical protein